MGFEKFTQFQSAYWIEKALSVDNLFVFILVFGFFNVPEELHHKVLFWGVIGALVFRAIFIFAGVGLINLTYLPETLILGHPLRINILLLLFGIFLVYAGIKSWFAHADDDENKDFLHSKTATHTFSAPLILDAMIFKNKELAVKYNTENKLKGFSIVKVIPQYYYE
jgi:tellurite resistance protein TerC